MCRWHILHFVLKPEIATGTPYKYGSACLRVVFERKIFKKQKFGFR